MKIPRAMALKVMNKIFICHIGEAAIGETKTGRKAGKKFECFWLRMVIRTLISG